MSALLPEHLTVVRRLGAGERTAVYQVWSSRHAAAFACKTLLASTCDERAARRGLLREGQILRALAHPRVVRLFEIGAGDRPYLLLDLLDGPLASAAVAQTGEGTRALPVDAAVRLAMNVAAALLHVHERGYLHLDVKPENVVVVDGHAVLIDFSLARRRGPRRPAHRVGTRASMAPEQCLRLSLSPATDVFGLGCLLYRLLCGARPFPTGCDDTSAALERRYPQLVHDPSPLSSNGPDLPGRLEAVVLRCLRRDPRERFSDMQSVLGALAPFARRPGTAG